MIRAHGLTKRYGARAAIVDVSLDVSAGEVLILSGTNGSGRTTLLRLLALRSRPDSGALTLDGVDVLASPRLRPRPAPRFLEAAPALYEELTAREQLELVARCRDDVATPETAVGAQMAHFGLEPDGDRAIGELSAGLRQRLALACTLVGEPRVVLLDEPTSALDPWARDRLVARLRALALTGSATVVASNDLEVLWPACTRIALLETGALRRIVVPGGTASGPGDIMEELSNRGR